MYKLFSERKKEEQGLKDDTYVYDVFPEAFRNQFFTIINNLFDEKAQRDYAYLHGWSGCDVWRPLCESYAQEKGLKAIYDRFGYSPNTATAYAYYADKAEENDFLDLLDYSLTTFVDSDEIRNIFGKESVDAAIEEINYRFKQHSLGYEFVDRHLIEKTNEQIHKEIIKPAIHLLSGEEFAGANEEYFKAFDCFKQGDNKGAILNAGKAFESVLKVICSKMNYQLEKGEDTSKKLIDVLKRNNFFPAYLSEHLNAICTSLENGAPTIRNKTSGHGQGKKIEDISATYAEYTLNLVATNIVFLVKLCNEKRNV